MTPTGNRLCTITPELRVPYATLSHCWGDINILRLLKSNVENLHKDIAITDICLSFRQAMYTAYTLGLRYIWIDSLCIIQDDSQDWLTEASKMADIYKHAVLNIAASSARNGNEGCFRDRDPGYTINCHVGTNHSIAQFQRLKDDLLPKTLQNSSNGQVISVPLSSVQLRKMFSTKMYIALANQLGEDVLLEEGVYCAVEKLPKLSAQLSKDCLVITRQSAEDIKDECEANSSMERTPDPPQTSQRTETPEINTPSPDPESGAATKHTLKEGGMLSYSCVSSDFYAENFANAPLRRRAWIVQEQLLANRTLHFTKNQLFWTCKMRKACETFPDNIPEELVPHEQRANSFLDNPAWESIVAYYSTCDLTNKTDKLIALSGIARAWGEHHQKSTPVLQEEQDSWSVSGDVLGSHTPTQYLAGIWSNDKFPAHLCWCAQAKRERPAKIRAPSWSWAAVDGPVHIGPSCNWTPQQTFVTLLKYEFQLLGEDRYGAIKSGTLWLRCEVLIQITTQIIASQEQYLSIPGISVPVKIHWDCTDGAGNNAGTYLLLVYMSGYVFNGLVLTPSLKDQGQYQRMGHFTTKPVSHQHEPVVFAESGVDLQLSRTSFVQEHEETRAEAMDRVVMLV